MTAAHIADIYFDGRAEAAKKRLQKLKAAGLIAEKSRRVYERSILSLTRKAFALLESQGKLSELPRLGKNTFASRADVSEKTLAHELEVMDVKAAFHRTIPRKEKLSLLEFSTWPLLYSFKIAQGYGPDVLVKPDGFIRIHKKDEGTDAYECFLEVDRSSKDQGTLIEQVACYQEYYRSGGFAERNGASRSEFKKFPFRVLVVLKSVERRNNAAERLVQNSAPILTQAWLTNLAEVKANPLGSIWMRPGDYLKLVEDTPFYTGTHNLNSVYRRKTERDAFVESKIRKWHLLEAE